MDLSTGRGLEGGAVAACKKNILWTEEPLAQLFAGHRGCGKSTELRRLQRELEGEGYFVAYLEAEQDVDLEDTEPPDVLLALIHGLDRSLREAGVEVSKKLREEFQEWFADVLLEKEQRKAIEGEVLSEATIKGGVPFFGQLLSRFTGQIKTGSESKRLIRQKLDPRISQLLDRGRTFVEAARLALRKQGKKDLVLIVDSLDRIAFKPLDGGRSSHEHLFIERGDLLKGFRCHTVYTVPISLLHSPKLPNLAAIFPERHVLPMVKLYDRLGRERSESGWELMRRLLAQRMDLDELFEPGAVEELVEASGGHPRHLMTLVRSAVSFEEEAPVSQESARRSVQRLANDYSRAIPKEHWPLLARVRRDRSVENDEEHQLMLLNLSVLEYQNDFYWCDVHPAVRRLSRLFLGCEEPSTEVAASQL